MDPGEGSPLMCSLPGQLHGASPRRDRLGQTRQLPRREMEAWPEGYSGYTPNHSSHSRLMGQEKARAGRWAIRSPSGGVGNLGHKKAK